MKNITLLGNIRDSQNVPIAQRLHSEIKKAFTVDTIKGCDVYIIADLTLYGNPKTNFEVLIIGLISEGYFRI